MTTDDATRILGTTLALSHGPARRHLDEATAWGKDWRWKEAGLALEAAYRELGAEPPEISHGALWHRGSHPIQVAADAEAARPEWRWTLTARTAMTTEHPGLWVWASDGVHGFARLLLAPWETPSEAVRDFDRRGEPAVDWAVYQDGERAE